MLYKRLPSAYPINKALVALFSCRIVRIIKLAEIIYEVINIQTGPAISLGKCQTLKTLVIGICLMLHFD